MTNIFSCKEEVCVVLGDSLQKKKAKSTKQFVQKAITVLFMMYMTVATWTVFQILSQVLSKSSSLGQSQESHKSSRANCKSVASFSCFRMLTIKMADKAWDNWGTASFPYPQKAIRCNMMRCICTSLFSIYSDKQVCRLSQCHLHCVVITMTTCNLELPAAASLHVG